MVGVLASRSNLPFSLGVVFGARFLGLSLLIIFSGVIADRLSRVQLLVASDAMRAAAVLGLLIAGLDAPVWTLALLTFAMGAGEAVFQPAYDAFIPDLVDGWRCSANATTNVLRSVGQFVGPALGAVIVTVSGPTTALTIDAARSSCRRWPFARRQTCHCVAGPGSATAFVDDQGARGPVDCPQAPLVGPPAADVAGPRPLCGRAVDGPAARHRLGRRQWPLRVRIRLVCVRSWRPGRSPPWQAGSPTGSGNPGWSRSARSRCSHWRASPSPQLSRGPRFW